MSKEVNTPQPDVLEFDVFNTLNSTFSFPSFEITKKSTVNIRPVGYYDSKVRLCISGTGGNYKTTVPVANLVILPGIYHISIEPEIPLNDTTYSFSIKPTI